MMTFCASLNAQLLKIYWNSIYLVICNFNVKWNFYGEHFETVQISVSGECLRKPKYSCL